MTSTAVDGAAEFCLRSCDPAKKVEPPQTHFQRDKDPASEARLRIIESLNRFSKHDVNGMAPGKRMSLSANSGAVSPRATPNLLDA